MGTRTEYTPGTFSWIDLATPDQAAAKQFYASLFGWEYDDLPAGEGVIYSMARVEGQHVAAIGPQPEQQRDAGVPPLWHSYVTVASADEVAERAKSLGAEVHAGPFDVLSAGRMAVVQDPQGAFFMLWEARENLGAGLVNEPGTLTWNELHTSDLDGAKSFYGELFGWSFDAMEGSPMPYWVIKRPDGGTNGAVTGIFSEGEPPNWLVYVGTSNTDESLARALELGGSKLADAMDIGPGRIAVVSDPQGAVFALYSGEFGP